jgi:transcriptional regulator with XRE-family HTH domain
LPVQIISNEQIRDARNLVRISGEDFCEKVGISRRSLQRMENNPEAFAKAAYETVIRMVKVLEACGIEFLPDGTVKKRASGGGLAGDAPTFSATVDSSGS